MTTPPLLEEAAGEAVPAAADRDGQPLLPRVAERVDHLRGGLRQQDRCR